MSKFSEVVCDYDQPKAHPGIIDTKIGQQQINWFISPRSHMVEYPYLYLRSNQIYYQGDVILRALCVILSKIKYDALAQKAGLCTYSFMRTRPLADDWIEEILERKDLVNEKIYRKNGAVTIRLFTFNSTRNQHFCKRPSIRSLWCLVEKINKSMCMHCKKNIWERQ